MLHHLLTWTLATSVVAMDKCNKLTTCKDCLNPNLPDCGWCSPKPAKWANGSMAYQCMDHRTTGWDCFNLYMHDGCVQGYTCDTSAGKCILAPPGKGDTRGNCEKTCKPPPPPGPPPPKQYECDAHNLTCVEVPSGGSEHQTCSSSCSNSTPPALVGLWRGLDVQANYSRGEWEMNFSSASVAWGPHHEPRRFVAAVASISQTRARLLFSAPSAMAGETLYASFSSPGWPTGPESHSVTIAMQKQGVHQVPPDDVSLAMGDPAFDVFVMHACNSWARNCSFAAAFASPPPPVPLAASASATDEWSTVGALGFLAPLADKCNVHKDCGSCIHDPLSTCGWCDGVIHFGDGTTCGEDGNGCCGGGSGFSHCNVTFRKECACSARDGCTRTPCARRRSPRCVARAHHCCRLRPSHALLTCHSSHVRAQAP